MCSPGRRSGVVGAGKEEGGDHGGGGGNGRQQVGAGEAAGGLGDHADQGRADGLAGGEEGGEGGEGGEDACGARGPQVVPTAGEISRGTHLMKPSLYFVPLRLISSASSPGIFDLRSEISPVKPSLASPTLDSKSANRPEGAFARSFSFR